MTAAIRHEFPVTTEVLTRTKQGHEVWISVSTIVVPSRLEELTVLIHVFREVTTQHELMRVVTEFASMVVSPLLMVERLTPCVIIVKPIR